MSLANITTLLAAAGADTTATNSRSIVGGVPIQAVPGFVYSGGNLLCGGTLIHEDIVLTAAHCGPEAWSSSIYIGGRYLSGWDAELKFGESYINHPSYDADTWRYDVMVLKLTSSSSQPVFPLAAASGIHDPAVGEAVAAIGYGATEFQGSVSSVLLGVAVDTYSTEVCGERYEEAESCIYDEIHICAGTESGGFGTCQGDSGGPIITNEGYQVGITSYGIGCAYPDVPTVYAKISGVRDFIDAAVCVLSENPPAGCGSRQESEAIVYPVEEEPKVESSTLFLLLFLFKSSRKDECPDLD